MTPRCVDTVTARDDGRGPTIGIGGNGGERRSDRRPVGQ